jgi:hypothetical protein
MYLVSGLMLHRLSPSKECPMIEETGADMRLASTSVPASNSAIWRRISNILTMPIYCFLTEPVSLSDSNIMEPPAPIHCPGGAATGTANMLFASSALRVSAILAVYGTSTSLRLLWLTSLTFILFNIISAFISSFCAILILIIRHFHCKNMRKDWPFFPAWALCLSFQHLSFEIDTAIYNLYVCSFSIWLSRLGESVINIHDAYHRLELYLSKCSIKQSCWLNVLFFEFFY